MKKSIIILGLILLTVFTFAQDEALIVDENGNVGIHNSSPQARLDVDGDIKSTGYVTGVNLFKEINEVNDTFPINNQYKDIPLPDAYNEDNLIVLYIAVKNIPSGRWYILPLTYVRTESVLYNYDPLTNQLRIYNNWPNNEWDNQPLRIVVARF